MKITSSIILMASLTLSLFSNAAEPLAMPEFEQTPEAMTLAELEVEVPKLNRALGAYPAMIFNSNHKKLIYQDWSNLLGATLILKPTSKEEATQKVHLMATLFVQGYNLNVTGAAAQANEKTSAAITAIPIIISNVLYER